MVSEQDIFAKAVIGSGMGAGRKGSDFYSLACQYYKILGIIAGLVEKDCISWMHKIHVNPFISMLCPCFGLGRPLIHRFWSRRACQFGCIDTNRFAGILDECAQDYVAYNLRRSIAEKRVDFTPALTSRNSLALTTPG